MNHVELEEQQGQQEPIEQAFVAPTAAEKQARLKALVSGADEREAVHKAVENDEDLDDDTIPISERATLGIAERFTIGSDKPLQLFLRAPVIQGAAQIREQVMRWFPDILIGAATSDRYGKGIEIDSAAIFWSSITESLNEKIAEANANGEAEAKKAGEEFEPEKLLPVASLNELRHMVLKELDDFTACLQAFDFKNPNANDAPDAPHPLNSICDIVWALAQYDNPAITREGLPLLLVSRMRTTEFADLLRAIFRCLSGSDVTYESDPFAVFFTN